MPRPKEESNVSQDTDDSGRTPVYDVRDHRAHHEHKEEAIDLAHRADALEQMCEAEPPDFADEDAHDAWIARVRRYRRAAISARDRAQLHATLAVYEALVLPGYGISVGDQLEHEREQGSR